MGVRTLGGCFHLYERLSLKGILNWVIANDKGIAWGLTISNNWICPRVLASHYLKTLVKIQKISLGKTMFYSMRKSHLKNICRPKGEQQFHHYTTMHKKRVSKTSQKNFMLLGESLSTELNSTKRNGDGSINTSCTTFITDDH